ncbi:MAG: phenylalanine--tRNA ligase subunit beta, partial [Bryobacteraceae bacterium]
DVYLAEILLAPFFSAQSHALSARRYTPISRYQSVERDFSLVLADGVSFAGIAKIIRELKIAEVVAVEAVDLFRGGQVPAGKYSLLVRVTFQSAHTTLTDLQLTDFSGRIVAALAHTLGASLRKV